MEHNWRWGRADPRGSIAAGRSFPLEQVWMALCPWGQLPPCTGHPREGGVVTHSFWARAAVTVQRLPNDQMEIWSKQTEPQAPRFWMAVISHLFFKQGILILCRITVWSMLPSISLIPCKFTSNSYCQNTVWHSHSTCFFSDEHKATSVQREYVASP